MKINERTLLHIAQSSDNPTDESGSLLMWIEERKAFQRRWVVLKENLFFYYDHRTAREPVGVVILEGCQVEVVDNAQHAFSFKIDFGTNQRGKELKSYIFATETQAELEKWMKCLSCASYTYLAMVVSELQHKLSELKTLKKGVPMCNSDLKSATTTNRQLSNIVRINPFDEDADQQDEQCSPPPANIYTLHQKYHDEIRKYLQ